MTICFEVDCIIQDENKDQIGKKGETQKERVPLQAENPDSKLCLTAEWFSRPSGSLAAPSLKTTKQMKNGPQHRKAYDYNLCTDRWHSLCWCLQFCSHQEGDWCVMATGYWA